MRATILLEQQHRQVEALLKALEFSTKAQVGGPGQQGQQGQQRRGARAQGAVDPHGHEQDIFSPQVTSVQPGEAMAGGSRQVSPILGELATVILGHMAIEEEIFYPSTMQIQRDRVLQNYIEHDTEVGVLRQLLATDPADVSFRPLLRVLKGLLDQHVKAEEESLFPATEQLMAPQHNELLGQQMQARFDQVIDQGHQQTLVQRRAIELAGRSQQCQSQAQPQVHPQAQPQVPRQAKPKGPGPIR